jgi:hypothetical protein
MYFQIIWAFTTKSEYKSERAGGADWNNFVQKELFPGGCCESKLDKSEQFYKIIE